MDIVLVTDGRTAQRVTRFPKDLQMLRKPRIVRVRVPRLVVHYGRGGQYPCYSDEKISNLKR